MTFEERDVVAQRIEADKPRRLQLLQRNIFILAQQRREQRATPLAGRARLFPWFLRLFQQPAVARRVIHLNRKPHFTIVDETITGLHDDFTQRLQIATNSAGRNMHRVCQRLLRHRPLGYLDKDISDSLIGEQSHLSLFRRSRYRASAHRLASACVSPALAFAHPAARNARFPARESLPTPPDLGYRNGTPAHCRFPRI